MKIGFAKTLRNHYVYLLMIAPALIGFSIFFILPTLMNFGYSLTNWSVYKPNYSFIGLKNFVELVHDVQTTAAVKNAFIYAIVMTLLQNILAIPLAVALSLKLKSANLLKTVFFAPAILSVLIVGYLWSFIMTSADHGLLNQLVQFFGFGPINWLGNPKLALFSVLFTQLWQWTGWAMVIYLANIQSIDETLYEAAKIDGANAVQRFFKVTLPLLYPSVSFNVLMSMIGGLKVFDIIFSMTSGGPGYSTETITTMLIRRGFTEGRTAYAAAFGVIFFLLVLIVSKAITWSFNKWEEKIS
ncbi:raffinose/stachyose/melibiose transport system permease protein [Paenibacillus anaericanus]|uniref:carbohydrate ABC transporter permease n=1 Tax=Paenibacillus TaxID=44249 RepID=UPI0027866D63|nr:sugar ABC transporter permease [Paenibacillus anaericanus]MDQ0089502.1 raffinose/stachyose/melibiose transport system permease protein [Paenibacillus anaericanus]